MFSSPLLPLKTHLTLRKYTADNAIPWFAIFTILTTRVSDDVKAFRNGPGMRKAILVWANTEHYGIKGLKSCIA